MTSVDEWRNELERMLEGLVPIKDKDDVPGHVLDGFLVVKTAAQWDEEGQAFLESARKYRIISIDTEANWGESRTKYVAAAVPTSSEPILVLFDLPALADWLPATFFELLKASEVFKVGSGLKKDKKDCSAIQISAATTLDLNQNGRALLGVCGIYPDGNERQAIGLKKICKELGYPLYGPDSCESKRKALECKKNLFNWERPLSDGQKAYLRNDLVVPLNLVFRAMIAHAKESAEDSGDLGGDVGSAVFDFCAAVKKGSLNLNNIRDE